MKKYITSVVGIFALFILGNFYNGGGNQSVVSQLKSDIAALQKKLPSKIDSLSTVVGARFENNIVSYDVVLDLFSDGTNEEKIKNMQRNGNIFYNCLTPKVMVYLNEIDAIQYNYTLKPSEVRFTTTVKQSDCQPFSAADIDALGEYYVQLQNSTVPIAVDSETNLIQYSKEGKTITLDYQLHSWLLAELDISYFKSVIDDGVIPQSCEAPDFKALTKKGYKIRLRYFDSRNDEVYIATVPTDNCS